MMKGSGQEGAIGKLAQDMLAGGMPGGPGAGGFPGMPGMPGFDFSA